MASDYGMRGAAADRLLKGKKGAPPPEEDELGLPPEDAAAPEGGEPPMDLAALLGGGASPEPMPDEGAPMPEEGGAPDLDTALAGVEGALEGMPPEAAEEIRTHLNAIREIAAQGGGAPPAAMPMDAGPMAGEAPPPVGATPDQKEIGG